MVQAPLLNCCNRENAGFPVSLKYQCENGSTISLLPLLQAIALFRVILVEQILRYAGVREAVKSEHQALGLKSGINAMLIGHNLTTREQPLEQDRAMLKLLRLTGARLQFPESTTPIRYRVLVNK